MIFDTHAHYDDEAFDGDRDELLAGLPAAGIGRVVNIAASPRSIDECLDLAHRFPHVYCALGIHPEHCAEMTEELLEEIRGKLADDKAVAVGEIGLDYYYGKEFASEQREALHWQLDYARERDLPVNIHLRDAMGDFLEILKDHKGLRGNMHAYSGSYESFLELQELGDWYIGVGGVVTFKKASLADVVRKVPLERIVLETDAPYLAPVPFRGKRNTSALLPYVVEAIAELKGMEAEDVIRITEENARRMYRISA